MDTALSMIFAKAAIGFLSRDSGWQYPSGPSFAIVAIRWVRPSYGIYITAAASSSAASCRRTRYDDPSLEGCGNPTRAWTAPSRPHGLPNRATVLHPRQHVFDESLKVVLII